MNVLAWVLQGLLAVVYLFHGVLYSISPEPLVRGMREQGLWPPAIPSGFRVFIGIAEILAAIGLILPSVTGILPGLTPLAALGLLVVMAGAAIYHARRRELGMVGAAVVLFVLVAVAGYLRWRTVPL